MWWFIGLGLIFLTLFIAAVLYAQLIRVSKLQETAWHDVISALSSMEEINICQYDLLTAKITSARAEVDRIGKRLVERDKLFLHPSCTYQYMMPRMLIQSIVDNNRVGQIRREKDYLNELRLDIETNGLKEPLEINFDESGFVKLQEGHHRFLILDYDFLPVVVAKVTKANSRFNFKNVEDVLQALGKIVE